MEKEETKQTQMMETLITKVPETRKNDTQHVFNMKSASKQQ